MKKFIKFLKLFTPPIFLKVIVNNKTFPVKTFKTYDEAIDFCDSYSNNETENLSVVGVQKSDLSTNGVGRQIPETLKIKNRDIQYPFTVIGKEDFEKLIKKYTDIVFSIREQKEAYVTEKGIFNLYGYLLIKKSS